MGVDATTYREAMSRLGAAVNIITTRDETGPHGFTASAVCSVTDAPPTLLVCVNRNVRSRSTITVGGALCINTLTPAPSGSRSAPGARWKRVRRCWNRR